MKQTPHTPATIRSFARRWTILRHVFRWTPQPAHGVRRRILKLCGSNIAATTKIRPSVRIDCPWNLSAGDLTIFGDYATLLLSQKCSIGSRCVISQYALVATSLINPDQPAGTPDVGDRLEGQVEVEDDCWVAADALVMPGTRIRAGSVIGARATAGGEVPGWSVCVGEPAKPIKRRTFRQPPTP